MRAHLDHDPKNYDAVKNLKRDAEATGRPIVGAVSTPSTPVSPSPKS